MSRAYAAEHGIPLRLEDLVARRLMYDATRLGARSTDFGVQEATGTVRRVPLAGSVTVCNSEAYRVACRAGLGLVQAPVIGPQAELAFGELVEVLSRWRAPALP